MATDSDFSAVFTGSLEGLDDREFDIGKTRFRIRKLLAFEAYREFEHVREALGAQMQTLAIGLPFTQQLSSMILGLPAEAVGRIRRAMFRHVTYTTPQVRDWTPLDGQEDSAFAELEMSAVYEVLVRCLAVNFTPSFRDILSRLMAANPDSPSPEP